MAQIAGQLILQQGLYLRRTFTFTLSWEYSLLDPMDCVEVSDPYLGLDATLVRIIEIEEGRDGLLTVTAREVEPGVATATSYALQATSNGAPGGNATPPSINAPIIWEPPLALSGGTVQVWSAVCPNATLGSSWGGCIENGSFDGSSYTPVATLNGPSIMGTLLSSLAAYSGSNPDNTHTLSVDLTESASALNSTTSANAAAGLVSLCYVDGEYLAFTTATLGSPFQYALTGLYRGLYGSTAGAHSAGAAFVLLAGPLLKYTLPVTQIGSTLYLKFQSFNLFGGQTQPLSSCTQYTYGVSGTGAGAANYTPVWTQAGVSPPTLGNGTLTGSYARNSAGTFVTVSITLVAGSTTVVTNGPGSAAWQFSVPFSASAAASGSFTIDGAGGGTVVIAANASIITLYGSSNVWDPPSTGAGATYSMSITYPTAA